MRIMARVMTIFTLLFAGAAVVAPAGCAGVEASPTPANWQPLIAQASQRFGIPEAWIRAVMRAQSGGQTTLDGHPITSSAGAMGLMQVMPETWDQLRDRYDLGGDPYDPRDNILAGTAYLRELYDRYGYPGLFAAYNAGPARLDAYLFSGRPLPGETLAYLRVLGQPVFVPLRSPITPSGNGPFFALQRVAATVAMPSPAPSSAPSSGGLFVPLKTVPKR